MYQFAEKPTAAIEMSVTKATVRLSPLDVTVGGFLLPQNRPPIVLFTKTGDVAKAPSLNMTYSHTDIERQLPS